MVEEYDVAIIGAGVAGLTAALYASGQKVKTVVISQGLGGQLNLIPRLENYPGSSSLNYLLDLNFNTLWPLR